MQDEFLTKIQGLRPGPRLWGGNLDIFRKLDSKSEKNLSLKNAKVYTQVSTRKIIVFMGNAP